MSIHQSCAVKIIYNEYYIVHTLARILGLEIVFRASSEQEIGGGAAGASSGKSILIDMETFTRGLMDVYMPQGDEEKMKLLFRM